LSHLDIYIEDLVEEGEVIEPDDLLERLKQRTGVRILPSTLSARLRAYVTRYGAAPLESSGVGYVRNPRYRRDN
jgi:hypothetical protein